MNFFSSQLVVGQYIPGDTLVHRLNPFLKLVLTLAAMVNLFVFTQPYHYVLFALTWLLVYRTSGLKLSFFLRGLRPLFFLISFTFLLHTVLTPGRKILFTLGPMTATYEGLLKGCFFTSRLVLLVSLTSLLTLTTPTVELTFAIERLTQPLRLVGFPSEEFAMMLTIALRFIPVLFLELDKIVKAQRCRGVSFTEGSWANRLQSYVSILIPLFLNTFERALELATAMEVRCYEAGARRGSLRRYPLRPHDVAALVGFFVLTCWAVQTW